MEPTAIAASMKSNNHSMPTLDAYIKELDKCFLVRMQSLMLGKKHPGSVSDDELLICYALARDVWDWGPTWDIWTAAWHDIQKEATIEETRRALLTNKTDWPASTFDVTVDSWTLNIARPQKRIANVPGQCIGVELFDPFCFMDVPSIETLYVIARDLNPKEYDWHYHGCFNVPEVMGCAPPINQGHAS